MEPKGLKSMAIKEIKINKIQYNKSQLNKIRGIKKQCKNQSKSKTWILQFNKNL